MNDRSLPEIVFGSESTGETALERAATTSRRWVRGQDHLTLYEEERHGAVSRDEETGISVAKTGALVLSSEEALEIFGIDILYEALDYGSAIITRGASEPGSSFIRCREKRSLSRKDVAEQTGLREASVANAESAFDRTHMSILITLCHFYEIDPRRISFESFGL